MGAAQPRRQGAEFARIDDGDTAHLAAAVRELWELILDGAPDIPANQARRVIDAKGLYVTPGLIDLHVHVFYGDGPSYRDGQLSVIPDSHTLRSGVTTVVDAGTVAPQRRANSSGSGKSAASSRTPRSTRCFPTR